MPKQLAKEAFALGQAGCWGIQPICGVAATAEVGVVARITAIVGMTQCVAIGMVCCSGSEIACVIDKSLIGHRVGGGGGVGAEGGRKLVLLEKAEAVVAGG